MGRGLAEMVIWRTALPLPGRAGFADAGPLGGSAALTAGCGAEGSPARQNYEISDAMKLADPLQDAVKAVPDLSVVPSFARMVANTQAMAMRFPDLVDVTRVGVSAQGIPIDMISIGDGQRSALFVGAPHPNEVVGCLLIEHLIDRLCTDPLLRQDLGYRCHFIKAIEPDALRLNEGWFCAPGDLQRYYDNYYRPPLDQQAEYAFPFGHDDRWTRHPMPENLAWRTAIELAQPDFLCSLHNAEFGGAHFLTSAMPADLALALKKICGTYGLTLNTVGDRALNEHPWEPGLFRFPDMKDVLARHPSASGEPGARPVGNSSAGYSASRGTFSLFAEVPYWDCERLRDTTLSPYSRTDLEADRDSWNSEVVALARRVLDLDCSPSNIATINMWRVLRTHADQFAEHTDPHAVGPGVHERLTWSEYTMRRVCGQLERLSTLGIARQVSLASLDRGEGFRLAAQCAAALTQQTERLTHVEGLLPVPLRRLVQVQLHAALTAMTALEHSASRMHQQP